MAAMNPNQVLEWLLRNQGHTMTQDEVRQLILANKDMFQSSAPTYAPNYGEGGGGSYQDADGFQYNYLGGQADPNNPGSYGENGYNWNTVPDSDRYERQLSGQFDPSYNNGEYGSYTGVYDAKGNLVDVKFSKGERHKGWFGENIDWLGPLMVGGVALGGLAAGAGMFGGAGAAAGGAGAAGMTAAEIAALAAAENGIIGSTVGMGVGGAGTAAATAAGGAAAAAGGSGMSGLAVAGVEGAASQAAVAAQAAVLEAGGTMAAANAAADIAAAAVGTATSGGAVLDGIAQGIKSIWSELPGPVKSGLGKALSSMMSPEAASRVNNALTGSGINIPGLISGGLQLGMGYDAMRRTRELGDELAGDYKQGGIDYADTMTAQADKAKTDYGAVGTDAGNKWTTLGDKVGTDLRNLSTATAKGWKDLGAVQADRWKQAGTEMKGLFDDAGTTSNQQWNDLGDKFQGQYDALGSAGKADYTALGSRGQGLYDDLGARGKADYTDLGQTFNAKYRGLGDEVKGLFDATGASGNARLTGVGDEYEGKFADAGAKFKTAWGDLGTEYEGKFTGLGREYEGKAGGIANQAKGMAGEFTPFAVKNDVGSFGSDGSWTLNKKYQDINDAAAATAQKSFDAARDFNPDTMRQDEFDLMQRVWKSQDEQDYLAHEERQRAQGRLGIQSFSEGNSQTFTDKDTGQRYTVGANPLDVMFQKAREQRDLEAFLKADDSAMKRRGEFITQGNEANKTPLDYAELGTKMGALAGDLGTRKFDARRSAADLWQQGMFKGLDYGFEGGKAGLTAGLTTKGKGVQADQDLTTTGLERGYSSSMEGARFNNDQEVTGTTQQASDYRTGLGKEYSDTRAGIDYDLDQAKTGVNYTLGQERAGIDYDLGQRGTGIDVAKTAATTGQGMLDTRTGQGLTQYGSRLDTGMGLQDTADTKALSETTRLDERAIDEVAKYTGKSIDEVRTATNKGLEAYQTLWNEGQKEKLESLQTSLRQKYNSDRDALKALTQIYNAAASRFGGMMGGEGDGIGATISSALGSIIKLFTDGGKTVEEAYKAIADYTPEQLTEMFGGDFSADPSGWVSGSDLLDEDPGLFDWSL